MPLTAVYNRINQAQGTEPGATANTTGASDTLGDASLRKTRVVSPAAGVVPTALTGDYRAGGRSPGAVLGTGNNPDLTTPGPEAV